MSVTTCARCGATYGGYSRGEHLAKYCRGRALVVNFFGGPGAGKSTTAAAVFAECKRRGLLAELVTEYAKDRVWEEAYRTLENQIYVFGKQHHRLWRVADKVDVIVTDSPLLLSLHYGSEMSPAFRALVAEEHRRLRSLNVMLRRVKPYAPVGRVQTEGQAREIDAALRGILRDSDAEVVEMDGDESAWGRCVDEIERRLAAPDSD